MSGLQWQDIAHRDPYLAGDIAARGYEWWQEVSPEELAASVGLVGAQRIAFLRGWQDELVDQAEARKKQQVQELEQMMEKADTGWDPAARWKESHI